MRILIAGLGSIGRRHLANLRLLEPDADIVVWRRHPPADAAPNEATGNTRVVYSVEEALAANAEAAFVTGPATGHVPVASLLAEQGTALFIEKPLSHTMEGVGELIAICRRKQLALMTGYNLRFDEPLRRMRQALCDGAIGRLLAFRAEVGMYLPDWRSGVDYRQGVSARSDLGGGAVLELSHELDYARWLGGEIEAVCALSAHVSDLDIDVEDMAEILIRFESGVMGNIHVDMVQRAPIRLCRLIGTEGTLLWDGVAHSLAWYSSAQRAWLTLVEPSPASGNEMYLAETEHFLNCVKSRSEPAVTGEDGARALAVALAVKHSSDVKQWVRV